MRCKKGSVKAGLCDTGWFVATIRPPVLFASGAYRTFPLETRRRVRRQRSRLQMDAADQAC